jgi:DNA-binding NtrC family response regulator
MPQVSGHILIVDDEPVLLRMMSTYLGRIGYAVSTLSNTAKALEALKAPSPDLRLLVLDASMQGASMEDLARRALQAIPSVRIIAVSGYPVDMRSLESAAPGRVLFVQKPFTGEMLASAIRRLLGPEEESV